MAAGAGGGTAAASAAGTARNRVMVAGAAGRDTGLASRILEASFRTETPKMFAALSLLVATGVLIFWLFNLLSRALLGRWHAGSAESPQP
jgi:NitT/TauT family transport system permease protein